jgi:hypothetical protein
MNETKKEKIETQMQNKLLLQLKAHGNGNKLLLPLVVCRVWSIRDSPLPIAPHVALPLCVSPTFLLLMSSSFVTPHTHTTQHTHTHTHRQKKEKKNTTKRKTKRPQKPQIKNTIFFQKKRKRSQRLQTKPHKTKNRKKNYEQQKGGEKGRKGKARDKGYVGKGWVKRKRN